jgi:phosphate transport system substrate-binding protein
MLKNRIVILLALLLLVILPFASVGAQTGTIVDVAAGNADFSTLVSLVQAAGLVDTLNGAGPFTVFAPTNEAFAKLPQVVVDYLGAHPEDLTRVLTYHVVGSQIMAADAMGMTEAGKVASVEGSELTVVYDGAAVKVDDATVTTADVAASNGVIHIIDEVLLPPFALPEIVPATLTGDIVADGSSTVEPLANAVAAQFTEEGFSGNLSIGESGTGGGFKAFCEELTTDIANASRPIKVSKDPAKAEESEKCIANNRAPLGFRVGTDGLAIVVNPANDFATDLTKDEVAILFSTAVNWSDVRADFPAEPIVRYIPGTDSGTFDYFVEINFATDSAPILAASSLNQSESDNVLVEGVKNNQYAVGFFGYAYYEANASDLKVVAVDGVVPNLETVEAATYYMARPLFIYSTAAIMQEKPQVAGFINYFLTNVDSVISEVGYFPASEFALNRARALFVAASTPAM